MPHTEPVMVWAVFPLTDLRPMSLPPRERVTKPWLDRTEMNFLRRFGALRYRRTRGGGAGGEHGSLGAWLGATENWFISARRFARLPERSDLGVRQPVPARLYVNSMLSPRLELVLKARNPDEDVQDFLQRVAGCPIVVPVRDTSGHLIRPDRELPLAGLSRAFRETYAVAVAAGSRRALVEADIAAGGDRRRSALALIRPSDPILIVYGPCDSTDPLRWGPTIAAGGSNLHSLLVAPPSYAPTDRSLRRAFVRLHCMESTMHHLASYCQRPGVGPPQSDWLNSLGTLVRQAEDCAEALRTDRNSSVEALNILTLRFGASAELLGSALTSAYPGNPEIARFAQKMTGVKVRWEEANLSTQQRLPRQDGLLPVGDLDVIHQVCTRFELFKSMDGLQQAIEPAIVAKIPTAAQAADLLWNNLAFLNGLPDSGPLRTWLSNSSFLIATRKQVVPEVLQRAISQLAS